MNTICKIKSALVPGILILALWLSGCTPGVSRAPASLPDNIPGTFGSSVDSSVGPSVDLGDLPIAYRLLELIDSPQLHVLVIEALENNPDIRAAAFRLESSRYLLA